MQAPTAAALDARCAKLDLRGAQVDIAARSHSQKLLSFFAGMLLLRECVVVLAGHPRVALLMTSVQTAARQLCLTL